MFCTIKFVYYKSFCVRDDIGSYIRTVYHMVSHTPKRKAVCSNHIGDASALSRKVSHEIFRVFANKKEDQLTNC